MCQYAITAIMPSLNEEKNLASAVRNIISSYTGRGSINGEIVIVNDGSTDTTGKIAEDFKAKYSFVQVLHHDRPQGIGSCFWDGVKAARGEVVVFIPGDGENDAAEILRYLPLMAQVDMVVPYIFNRQVRSWTRQTLSTIYRGIINLTFGTTLNYMNGTVLYRKSILGDIDLKAKGFFYQTELLVKCIRRGYLYAEVPCALLQRVAGRSKSTTFKSLRKVVESYFVLLREIYWTGRKRIEPISTSVTASRWKGCGTSADSGRDAHSPDRTGP